MLSQPPHMRSLSSKLLTLTIAWLLLAMTSIGYTLVLSWKLEGGAAAINDAGSLRMRSYRVAMLVSEGAPLATVQAENQHFSDTLASLRKGDPARPLFLPDNDEVRLQANEIEQHWRKELLPRLELAASQPHQPGSQARPDVSGFVDHIDRLVKLIEEDNARNTTLLRFFQMALIAMAIVGSFAMMFLLFLLVIRPLNTLGEGIARLRDGELDARMEVSGNDEFALISTGFNQMASHLQELYATLEQKVEDKTRSVEEKNRHLTALYGTTAFLHESHELEPMCDGFIGRLMELTGADAGSVRLVDVKRGRLELIAQRGLPPEMLEDDHCAPLEGCYCGEAVPQPFAVIRRFDRMQHAEEKHCQRAGYQEISVFHIRYNQGNVGIFTLYFRQVTPLSPQDQFLLETLGSHLGIAIENLRLAARDRQFAVAEERNLMAQGLHDSIAQSLSFLNLQVQMLEAALDGDETEQAQENLGFIRTGVQECYEDVRELLLNFRTRINKEDFADAVRTLLSRFEQQAHVATQLNMQGNGLPLDPQQQLQVIFILQEALSNVRKHAQAQHVIIDIRNEADFVMTISDDGCGFDQQRFEARKSRHVGLSIMQERAARIHGHIAIRPLPAAGTEVSLTLPHTERQAA
ncbi:type IV pili methyl-accepting chemotaxis transducer N-terminal domain-containing protein [Vogesella sp. LIG4]|uniref:type IV pili methyl-accepting chemotaxis transducer N-terminal domain-containing protein n=1 Tax=Vogesella sp. LIG4 TaxID=1192162 RepID=UPI00081FB56F|nr:type IV pili methyl-accepting chemotaxis transducer N-terminal domain-containing protein [Vogesella sp. LIG4]SCK23595.1 two-component system, NarL family, nitrate/nitrite sensor histidine kinase NarX [Vogesella sp. LIG4]